VSSANNEGIWSEGTGSLQLVARTGSAAPGAASGVDFHRLDNPALNAAGQTAFSADIRGSGVSPANNAGIWSEGSGSLDLAAREGDQAPGTPSGATYLFLQILPPLNAAGQTAFAASLTGSGVTNANREGIWSEGSGSLSLVARGGDSAPGTPNGVLYDELFGPSLNAAGYTAFKATLTGGAVGAINQGIWSDASGSRVLVARTGDQAPGTPSGVNFSEFFGPALNAAGQTAFLATLTGSGVTGGNDRGFWATDANGATQLIAREGDLLEVAPGDFRTISLLSFFGNSGNGDGRRSGFNDVGQLAFLADFTDGSSGIFVSNRVRLAFTADFDEDDDVDGDDLTEWGDGFGIAGTAVHMDGDADGDLDVDGGDFLAWQQQRGSGLPAPSQAVPEPGALPLLLASGLALATVCRRRGSDY
jgi:hypothetical protein